MRMNPDDVQIDRQRHGTGGLTLAATIVGALAVAGGVWMGAGAPLPSGRLVAGGAELSTETVTPTAAPTISPSDWAEAWDPVSSSYAIWVMEYNPWADQFAEMNDDGLSTGEALQQREQFRRVQLIAEGLPNGVAETGNLIRLVRDHSAEMGKALDLWIDGRFDEANIHFAKAPDLIHEIRAEFERLDGMPTR